MELTRRIHGWWTKRELAIWRPSSDVAPITKRAPPTGSTSSGSFKMVITVYSFLFLLHIFFENSNQFYNIFLNRPKTKVVIEYANQAASCFFFSILNSLPENCATKAESTWGAICWRRECGSGSTSDDA